MLAQRISSSSTRCSGARGRACGRQRNRRLQPLAAAADSADIVQRVADLRRRGADLYNKQTAPELAAAVADLIASNPSKRPGPESISDGQGTWEVFHAPHIAGLSAALGARFQPIRYTLRGKEIISNVRYQHPLLGTGWLSASGTISAADDATLLLHFDKFWVDFGNDSLRTELAGSSSDAAESDGMQRFIDAAVGLLGRAAFLPSLARFPVQHLDAEAGLSVFRFPPLASSIAIERVSEGCSNSRRTAASRAG